MISVFSPWLCPHTRPRKQQRPSPRGLHDTFGAARQPATIREYTARVKGPKNPRKEGRKQRGQCILARKRALRRVWCMEQLARVHHGLRTAGDASIACSMARLGVESRQYASKLSGHRLQLLPRLSFLRANLNLIPCGIFHFCGSHLPNTVYS